MKATSTRHPLLLWREQRPSAARREQARLLLVDVATERAQGSAAEAAATHPQLSSRERARLEATARRWRIIAGGVALGEAACLIALARGLTKQLADHRDPPALDPILTALQLARLGGSRSERIAATVESLLILPGLVQQGRSGSRLRRGYSLVATLNANRSLRWLLSVGSVLDPQIALTAILQAWVSVEAEAIRRGLIPAGIDRTGLSAVVEDLLAARPVGEADMRQGGAIEDEGSLPEEDQPPRYGEGLTPVSTANSVRGQMLRGDTDPSNEQDDPLVLVPFPGFDPDRSSSGRDAFRKRYSVLAKRLPMAPVPGRDAGLTALNGLRAEHPNFGEVIDLVADELALARRLGPKTALLLPPMLLLGKPGVGKTRFARRLAECLQFGFGWLALAGSSDNRELAGTARGWSSAHPSWPVEQLVSLKRGNPLLLVDEVDKAGGSDHNGRAVATLLTLLEPGSAAAYHDECLGGPIDLSRVSWILTANSADALPTSLLSRLSVMPVPPPSADQVGTLIHTMLQDFARQRGLADARLLPTLSPGMRERLQAGYASVQDPRQLKAALVRSLAIAARAEEEEDGASRRAPVN